MRGSILRVAARRRPARLALAARIGPALRDIHNGKKDRKQAEDQKERLGDAVVDEIHRGIDAVDAEKDDIHAAEDEDRMRENRPEHCHPSVIITMSLQERPPSTG